MSGRRDFIESYELIDSHCHFDFPVFDKDREAVWRTCNQLGINRVMIPGVSIEQWSIAATLCNSYTGMYYSVGLHPWWIKEFLLINNQTQLCENLYQHL